MSIASTEALRSQFRTLLALLVAAVTPERPEHRATLNVRNMCLSHDRAMKAMVINSRIELDRVHR